MASTLLRHIFSKDIDLLEAAVEALPFKIEIKGGPVMVKGKWYLYFTLDEKDNKAKKFVSQELEA